MIYLKKDNDTQTAYIPKNGSYEGRLSYKDGYEAGKAEGIEEGRNNPITTKEVYFDNGIKSDTHNVAVVDFNLGIPTSPLKGSNYIETTFFPYWNNGCIFGLQTSSSYLAYIQNEKLYITLNNNNTVLERPCTYAKWHTLRIYTDRCVFDGEEIFYGETFETEDLIMACINRGGRGYYRGEIAYIKHTEDEQNTLMWLIPNPEAEQRTLIRVRKDNTGWSRVDNFLGIRLQIATANLPISESVVFVEGDGICPELTELNVSENGRYEGSFNVVNVDVPDVNGSYDEGYNNGYNDGLNAGGDCPELTELNVSENGTYEGAYNIVNVNVPTEGGSCNLQDKWVGYGSPDELTDGAYVDVYPDEGYDGMSRVVADVRSLMQYKYDEGYNNGKAEGGGSCILEETRWGNPLPLDVNENYLIIQPSMGYDGMKKVALNMEDYDTEKYNEGYEAGKAEGGSCNLGELNINWESGWNENNFYAENDSLDGYNSVHIDATTALQNKYDEGYNNAIINDANLTPSNVEKKFNTHAFRTENLYDSDIILDRTLLVGSGDEYTENGFISYTQNKNGIVISGSDEVGAKYVTKIRKDALNWNTIEYFYSYTIVNFGVDMTRDMASNVRHLYIKYNGGVGTGVDSDIYFRTGCFATSNLLNKIVFYEPYYINVEDKAFEGVSSNGNVIVVGEDNAENRAKYDTLMSQLGSEWTLTFVDEYNE